MTDEPQGMPQEEQPKIIVDDDWKAQAQAEKKRLDEELKSQPAPPADDAPDAEESPDDDDDEAASGEHGPRQLPPANFATLVTFMREQTMMALGGYQDRETGRPIVHLDLAKLHIDLLAILEDKTKGNLTDEERKILDHVIYNLRMQYVEFAQAMSAGPASPGGMAGVS